MITVIIAGGSGTRLWPLSTSSYPKHLLNLTGDTSLLQMTYARSQGVSSAMYVVTEASHADAVQKQLPDMPAENILIEPGRRGTGNCIVFALDVIQRRHAQDEEVAFVHSDHHIRDTQGFQRSLTKAATASRLSGKITLVGIEPTFPSTGFGYIERDGETAESKDAYHIQSFREKPDFETAKRYVQAGNYLWNCGYFVGSVETFLKEIAAVSPELQTTYETLAAIETPFNETYNQAYLGLPDLVIDYALSEKSQNLIVVPAIFDWMDVGSFADLHAANEHDEQNNYLTGPAVYADEVENAYIRNEEDKPLVVIGLDNIVVVNTSHGILVARKDLSQRVKDAVKKIDEDTKK